MTSENDSQVAASACRFGTHAPRDCPACVFALRGTTPSACPIPTREQASVEVRTVTEWRVETDATAYEFGEDEQEARAWLTICEGLLMCRTVATTTTAWTPATTHESTRQA